MSQIYSPSTVLSVGFGETLEQVIVLSDNKVATKTFAGKPVTRRDIMSLEDWKIMIGSQEIQTDYLPLPLTSAVAVPVPMAVAVAVPVPMAMAPVEETYPVGTKLSWTCPEGAIGLYFPNSRTAIVLKDGILQVKEQINGVIAFTQNHECGRKRVAQKFFSSLADWKATLPAGGSITSKAGEDYSVPSIKRKAALPITNTSSDIDYIKDLKHRFQVRSQIVKGESLDSRLARELANIRNKMAEMGNMASSTVNIKHVLDELATRCHKLNRSAIRARTIQGLISDHPAKANTAPFHFNNEYKQRLVAFVGGTEVEITCDYNGTLLGLDGNAAQKSTCGMVVLGYPTVGKTFTDLGIDMKADGKPRLKVYYRCESIEI